jgi:predicted deacylase
MARAFGAPVSIHADERDGSLRQAASRRGVPTLLYEGGEALRHDAAAVSAGTRGVLRVMGALGMIDDPPPPAPRGIESRDTDWVRAPRSGYLLLETALGARVRRHERIGTLHMRVRDEEPGASDAVIRAPESGIVIGHATNPLVHVGDAIVHIARPAGRKGAGR